MYTPQANDLKWGRLEMTRFTDYQVWDGVKPCYLELKSSSKGTQADAAKHIAAVMQHRDPMQCCISMFGLYFAYQLITLQEVRHFAFDHCHVYSLTHILLLCPTETPDYGDVARRYAQETPASQARGYSSTCN
jgi:hypothetical protein